jgi:hypothetical protein
MRWSLIFALSLFGLAMAIATITLIPSNVEPAFWLAIFLVCAYVIGKRAPGRTFLHGLVLGLVNGVWVTAAHVLFFNTYLAHHPQEAAMSASMPLAAHPRVMMTIVGPVVGAVSGIIIGVLAWLAMILRRRRPAAAAQPR